jgi:flagellar protein FliS
MSRGAQAVATYQEVQVTSRSPLELVVMLYDGALASLRHTHDAMLRNDLVAKRDGMKKAMRIVQHLQSSLNMDEGGEVAAHLDVVYRDVVSRILEANLHRDPAPLEECIRLLTPIREAWHAIAQTSQSGESDLATASPQSR